jgi:hypothetical protein
MRAFAHMGSSHGGVAASKPDDRGFDSFRACLNAPDHISGLIRTLKTAEASLGPAATPVPVDRSRHGAQLAVDQPSSDTGSSILSRPTTCASRLTGRAPGSYPGTDWVRGPGRAPSRRSSASRAPVCRAGGRGCNPRRRRHVDVAQGTRHRSANPEDAGSSPAVDTNRQPTTNNSP